MSCWLSARDILDIVVAFSQCERPHEPAPSKLICLPPPLPAPSSFSPLLSLPLSLSPSTSSCNPSVSSLFLASCNSGGRQMRANVWLTRNYIHLAASPHFVAALYRQFVAGATQSAERSPPIPTVNLFARVALVTARERRRRV